MKLIALIIALVLERLATQLFHLRTLRWLDYLIDPLLNTLARALRFPAWLAAVTCLVVLSLPVVLMRFGIGDALLGVPFVMLSVVVLFFSLGPEDIGEEVEAWCRAAESGDDELRTQQAKAILECDPRPNSRMADAIFIQGNNRIFSVVFWFIVLGPIGAAAVRIADLIRRRALFQLARAASDTDETTLNHGEDATAQASVAAASDAIHSLLVWVPARITALSYALAGSFDSGREAWSVGDSDELGARNDHLLANVGSASLSFAVREDETDTESRVREARQSIRLVYRALIFWAVAVAALTLFGPAV